jgi:hypothetical protein
VQVRVHVCVDLRLRPAPRFSALRSRRCRYIPARGGRYDVKKENIWDEVTLGSPTGARAPRPLRPLHPLQLAEPLPTAHCRVA